MSITKLSELSAVLNIPHGNKAVVRPGYDIFKLSVVESERNRRIVGSLRFFLCLEEPEVDLA